jgi:hypothetical protein
MLSKEVAVACYGNHMKHINNKYKVFGKAGGIIVTTIL